VEEGEEREGKRLTSHCKSLGTLLLIYTMAIVAVIL